VIDGEKIVTHLFTKSISRFESLAGLRRETGLAATDRARLSSELIIKTGHDRDGVNVGGDE
jgi:hypothetical protein